MPFLEPGARDADLPECVYARSPRLRMALGSLVARVADDIERERRGRESSTVGPLPFVHTTVHIEVTSARYAGWPQDRADLILSLAPGGPECDGLYVPLPSGRVAIIGFEPDPVLRYVATAAAGVPTYVGRRCLQALMAQRAANASA